MRAKQFTTEAALGTNPKREKRAGSRPDRGHEPQKRYVTDRKTGKQYDPDEEFSKTMNSPEVMAQMKRMAAKEDLEQQHGDLKPWAYWNSPERVAKKLYQIHKGEPIGKDEVKHLWKVDGPDRMTKFMLKPDLHAILATYAQMSAQGSLLEGADERKQNALWAQITQHEKQAKATKNDIKKQHHMKMASDLRGQLKTSDLEEGSVTKKPQPYNDPNWTKRLSKEQLDKIAGPRLKKKEEQKVKEHMSAMEAELEEHGKASRELCKSSKPDADLGASMLASCKSQGLRARDGNKSHKLGKTAKSRIKVGGHRIKGNKYGGPLPDWS